MRNSLPFLTLIFFLIGNHSPLQAQFKLSDQHTLTFLDSLQATTAITKDRMEGFFEKIQPLDMSIQMRKSYPPETKLKVIQEDYRAFLHKDVGTFSPEEQAFLLGVITDIHILCNSVSKDIFPKELQLIKTHAKHYGAGVFYTRENGIIIPASDLKMATEKHFTSVMLHELFHVYSRLNPDKKEALYNIIGFKKLMGDLNFPENLKSQLLLNPDGLANYSIELKTPQGNINAIPIIYSPAAAFNPKKPLFFQYLNFELFQIIQHLDGNYSVVAEDSGSSTLNLSSLMDFYKQIGDNTQYIIHPDEILADNFMFLVLSKTGKRTHDLEQFSEAGQRILKKVEGVLKGSE